MTAAQVPGLKLKWSFGLAGAKQVFGEPSVVAGRVFFSADTGLVYSLNAATGCVYWTFQADAGVRTAVSIQGRQRAWYFGDQKANVYALDAAKGTLSCGKFTWTIIPPLDITGAQQVYQDRVYVPVASGGRGSKFQPHISVLQFSGQRGGAGCGDRQADLEDLHDNRGPESGRKK